MSDTYTKNCKICEDEFDWLPGTDQLCDDCLESNEDLETKLNKLLK